MKLDRNEMLRDIDAIIFDMDGTLIDSMWVWKDIDDWFYKEYQLSVPESFNEEMEGKSFTEVAELFLKTFPHLPYNLDTLKAKWTFLAFERYTKQVLLKDGVLEFLKEAYTEGYKLGIATSNGRELVDATLKALDIEKYFDSVHTSCEVKTGKPAPDIYLLVAEDLGVDAKKCLVFEDVPQGILAGKNAGMRVCAVEDEASKDQVELKKKLADYYINNFFEIENGNYEKTFFTGK